MSMQNIEAMQKFRAKGGVLYQDPNGQFEIHAGDIYEARTTKGHTNLIVALRQYEGMILYAHGDKVKKVDMKTFISCVEEGELELKWPDEIDTERLSMCAIMLDAIANRRTFEEAITIQEDQSEEYMHGLMDRAIREGRLH